MKIKQKYKRIETNQNNGKWIKINEREKKDKIIFSDSV
jgi:hypothetical protein